MTINHLKSQLLHYTNLLFADIQEVDESHPDGSSPDDEWRGHGDRRAADPGRTLGRLVLHTVKDALQQLQELRKVLQLVQD